MEEGKQKIREYGSEKCLGNIDLAKLHQFELKSNNNNNIPRLFPYWRRGSHAYMAY